MMKAEQFWEQWQRSENITHHTIDDWPIRLLEAYAAAQLAEKEREIARLTQAVNQRTVESQRWSARFIEEKARAEAAEQRLQEAQADNKRLRKGWEDQDANVLSLQESLRQREAELEHAVMCMDRSCKRCNTIVTERGERSTS